MCLATITILHGRNAVDIEDRVQAILDAADPQRFSTDVIDIEDATADAVRAAVTTPAFFGSARALHLRGVPGIDKALSLEWDELDAVLAEALPGCVVVLSTTQRIPSNRRILKSAAARDWTVESHDIPYGRDMERWVAARFERCGVGVDPRAVKMILDCLYPNAWQREDRWNPQTINMRLLATEIEKLAAAAAPGDVAVSHVEALTPDRSGVTAFKLNDDTYGGRPADALRELDNVLSSGEAPERVIGQVGYQPLVFLAARMVQRYGTDTVAEAAGVSVGQLKATIGRKSGWDNRDATAAATEELRRAEWLVKGGRAPNTGTVLVPAVAAISEKFRRK